MDDRVRRSLWETLADQFLDTETRTWIPAAARACVDAGLSPDEAFDIWRYEVTPAVYLNVWSVAGEWAYWPREWLERTIESQRGRWPNHPGALQNAIYRLRVDGVHRSWVAIEACMRLLAGCPVQGRAALVGDLTWLAQQFFDFVARPAKSDDVPRLRDLYATAFLPVFSPLVANDSITGESLATCRKRVEVALGDTPRAS